MTDFVVLGTGPVGVIVTKYLLKRNHSVTLIDNSGVKTTKEFPEFTLKNVDKSIYSEFFVNLKNLKLSLPIGSKSKGGFSKQWGGTLSELSSKDFEEWEMNYRDLFNYFTYIIKTLDLQISKSDDFSFTSSFENFDEISNIMFDHLLETQNNKIKFQKSKLFIDKYGEIWDAESTLRKLIENNQNLNYIDNFEVIDIKAKPDLFELHTKDTKIVFKNSKLLIATGPFPSSYLAGKLLEVDKYKIQNSDLRVLPMIWLGKNCKEKSSNTFPQLFVDFKNEFDQITRGQLYILNNDLIKTLGEQVSKITINLIKFINFLLPNRVNLMFIYDNSCNSNFFEFQTSNNKIETIKVFKRKNSSLVNLIFTFIKNISSYKLMPLPVYRKFDTYGSFHIGSSEFINKEGESYKFNEDGRIEGYSDIYFVDSSIFKNIPSGPTTFLSMAIALKNVDDILNKL